MVPTSPDKIHIEGRWVLTNEKKLSEDALRQFTYVCTLPTSMSHVTLGDHQVKVLCTE